MKMTDKKRAFTRVLFRWHKTHYRDMPWRKTHDPYRVLVSEIMLQQTQVARVRTKYAEFLKEFPTIEKLARMPLGEVLRAWSGLGYNRRARYLHECAKTIVREYGGKFPDDLSELKKLPGIGLSTAGALLAFSFAKDEPMIDTNVRRILVRTFFKKNIPADQELYHFAKTLISNGKGRAWNYAMLDLGATLCTARNHFPKCPLAKLHGRVGDFRETPRFSRRLRGVISQNQKPQKKFVGSCRFYRGKILRLLVEHGTITISELGKQLGKTSGEVLELVEVLTHERLVIFVRGKVALSG